MDKINLMLASLAIVAMAFIVAPSVIAMNRGKMLRNIAIWLAIFLALGLVYNNFGPGRRDDVVQLMEKSATVSEEQSGATGYNPPRE